MSTKTSLLISFFLLLIFGAYGQSIDERAKQKELMASLVNEIEQLKESPNIRTVFTIDLSTSIGIEYSEHLKTMVARLLMQRLRKPGDGVSIIFISDVSSNWANQIDLNLTMKLPDFSKGSFDEHVLTLAKFKAEMASQKKAIIRTVVQKFFSVDLNKNSSEILESLYPLSRLLARYKDKGQQIDLFMITDLRQASQLSSLRDLPLSPLAAKARGKRDAQLLKSNWDMKDDALAGIHSISVWFPGGLLDSDNKDFTILPFYWESVFSELSATVELQVISAGRL